MKKVISILLICAMLLSFGITITAEDSDPETSYTVTQRSRLTSEQIAPTSTNIWETTEGFVSIGGGAIGSTYDETDTKYYYEYDEENSDSFSVAHDGDYLYINVRSHYGNNSSKTTNRQTNFIYLDFTQDGTVDYVITMKTSSQIYSDANGDNFFNDYDAGVMTDRDNEDGKVHYANYALACNKESSLEHGIIGSRGFDDTKSFRYYNIVFPLPDEVRDGITSTGSFSMSVGYVYLQYFASTGGGSWYTNCGFTHDDLKEPTTDSLQNWWNAYYNVVSEEMLTSVTLAGSDQANEPSTDLNVQTPKSLPTTAGETYSLRLVGTLNTSTLTNLKNVGFKLKGDNEVNSPTSNVYTTCLANGYTVPAWWYGGKYFYFADITDIKYGKAYTLTVTTYYTDTDGAVKDGSAYTVNISKEGAVTLTK